MHGGYGLSNGRTPEVVAKIMAAISEASVLEMTTVDFEFASMRRAERAGDISTSPTPPLCVRALRLGSAGAERRAVQRRLHRTGARRARGRCGPYGPLRPPQQRHAATPALLPETPCARRASPAIFLSGVMLLAKPGTTECECGRFEHARRAPSPKIEPKSPKIGRNRAGIGRFRRRLANAEPESADVAENWSTSRQSWPMSFKIGRTRARIGRRCPNIAGRLRPKFAKFGTDLANIAQEWPNSSKLWMVPGRTTNHDGWFRGRCGRPEARAYKSSPAKRGHG